MYSSSSSHTPLHHHSQISREGGGASLCNTVARPGFNTFLPLCQTLCLTKICPSDIYITSPLYQENSVYVCMYIS